MSLLEDVLACFSVELCSLSQALLLLGTRGSLKADCSDPMVSYRARGYEAKLQSGDVADCRPEKSEKLAASK